MSDNGTDYTHDEHPEPFFQNCDISPTTDIAPSIAAIRDHLESLGDGVQKWLIGSEDTPPADLCPVCAHNVGLLLGRLGVAGMALDECVEQLESERVEGTE